MSESRHKLTDEQKREFYRDGFLILKKVIPEELAEVALDQIKQAKKGENLGGKKEMTDLVNDSPLTPILHEAMGYFDPPIYCQVGVMKKSEPGDYFNSLGYKDKDMVEKLCKGEPIPQPPRPKTPPPKPPQIEDKVDVKRWEDEYEKWRDDNTHVKNIPETSVMLTNLKRQFENAKQKQLGDTSSATVNIRLKQIEENIAKLMNNLGVK